MGSRDVKRKDVKRKDVKRKDVKRKDVKRKDVKRKDVRRKDVKGARGQRDKGQGDREKRTCATFTDPAPGARTRLSRPQIGFVVCALARTDGAKAPATNRHCGLLRLNNSPYLAHWGYANLPGAGYNTDSAVAHRNRCEEIGTMFALLPCRARMAGLRRCGAAQLEL